MLTKEEDADSNTPMKSYEFMKQCEECVKYRKHDLASSLVIAICGLSRVTETHKRLESH